MEVLSTGRQQSCNESNNGVSDRSSCAEKAKCMLDRLQQQYLPELRELYHECSRVLLKLGLDGTKKDLQDSEHRLVQFVSVVESAINRIEQYDRSQSAAIYDYNVLSGLESKITKSILPVKARLLSRLQEGVTDSKVNSIRQQQQQLSCAATSGSAAIAPSGEGLSSTSHAAIVDPKLKSVAALSGFAAGSLKSSPTSRPKLIASTLESPRSVMRGTASMASLAASLSTSVVATDATSGSEMSSLSSSSDGDEAKSQSSESFNPAASSSTRLNYVNLSDTNTDEENIVKKASSTATASVTTASASAATVIKVAPVVPLKGRLPASSTMSTATETSPVSIASVHAEPLIVKTMAVPATAIIPAGVKRKLDTTSSAPTATPAVMPLVKPYSRIPQLSLHSKPVAASTFNSSLVPPTASTATVSLQATHPHQAPATFAAIPLTRLSEPHTVTARPPTASATVRVEASCLPCAEADTAPHSVNQGQGQEEEYLSSRRRRRLNQIVPNPRKPRMADYNCSQCSELYQMAVVENPWWAVFKHECPKCHTLQVPRIDIGSASNAIELDPNVVALYGEGVGGSDDDEDGDCDEDEEEEEGSPRADGAAADDGGAADAEAEKEDLRKEVHPFDGEGLLAAEEASKLLVLMCHARSCAGIHASPKHAEICKSTKFLMLHIRDCSGTDVHGRDCQFPWCLPCKKMLRHLSHCYDPTNCVVCNPWSLPESFQQLRSLNQMRSKIVGTTFK